MSYNWYVITVCNVKDETERRFHVCSLSKAEALKKAKRIANLNEHEVIADAKPARK